MSGDARRLFCAGPEALPRAPTASSTERQEPGEGDRTVVLAFVDRYIVRRPEASTVWSQVGDVATYLESVGTREVVVAPSEDLGWLTLFETMEALQTLLPTTSMSYGLVKQDE